MLGESRLEAKLTWNVRQSASLEAKELGEQATDGIEIYLASDSFQIQIGVRNQPNL